MFEKAEKQGSCEAVSEGTMKTYDGPIELSEELSVSICGITVDWLQKLF